MIIPDQFHLDLLVKTEIFSSLSLFGVFLSLAILDLYSCTLEIEGFS